MSSLLLVLSFLLCCESMRRSDAAENCSSLWCGKHNIRPPFRLQNISQQHCGDQKYSLSCENHNQLFLYWKSLKLSVQSINYSNYTIRLADANFVLQHMHHHHQYSDNNSCLVFNYSLGFYNFRDSENGPYQYWSESSNGDRFMLMNQMIYVRCMNDSLYMNVNGKSLWELGMQDSCYVEWMYPTSWPHVDESQVKNTSCRDIQNMMLYGFELSWAVSSCPIHFWNQVRIDDHNHVSCYPVKVIAHAELLIGIISSPLIRYLGFGVPFGVSLLIVLCISMWRKRHLSIYDTIEDFLQSDNNIMPIRYSYKQIKNITGAFNTKLGNGGYGSVFQGKLQSGRLVAVKVLNKAKSNGQEFINEVATIGNVVQLIGFCIKGSKRALVYELMENGSLEKYIFSPQENASLSCEKLYTISLGIARGIEYLHNGCDMRILHFDIKPHNILLDENFNPKVSDFGLARLYPTDTSIVSLTAARGTIGYMAPELFYRNVGTISYKADVYSFGMLLMEMACRRKNLNAAMTENSSQIYFPFWVYDQLHDGREITIDNDTDEEMKLAKKMMIVALWCIQTKPNDRPSMKRVVEMLTQDDDLEMPPKPYFYPLDAPTEKNVEDITTPSSSKLSFEICSVSDSKE